jgi:LysM repeat protein
MSAIRPLATIALLLMVGVFLYTRINDAPLVPIDDLAHNQSDDAGNEVPDMFAAPGNEVSSSAATMTPLAIAPPAGDSPSTSRPDMPDLPDLPAWPTGEPDAGGAGDDFGVPDAGAAPSQTRDLPMPSEVPMARYGAPMSAGAESTPPTYGAAEYDETTPLAEPPSEPFGAAGNDVLIDPEPPSSLIGGPTVENDSMPNLAADEFAAPSEFSRAKPAIEKLLIDGQLATALKQLTEWYGNPSLTRTEADEVDGLISQLAGTVVYSREHLLAEPHTVAAGETLDTIAERYQVPWQLLAKINGVASTTGVSPGTELKVMQGPFAAAVRLDRQELVLNLAGHYAGRFGVTAQGDAATEGEWQVSDKQLTQNDAGESVRSLVLTNAAGDARVIVTSDPNAGGHGSPYQGAIRVAPRDEADLYDIMSIGSRVLVRR